VYINNPSEYELDLDCGLWCAIE